MSNNIKEFKIKAECRYGASLDFGQRLYTVVSTGDAHFKGTCPVCEDKKKVTINGIECRCPYCDSANREQTTVRHYRTIDIYVNEIKFSTTNKKNLLAKADEPARFVTYSAFFYFKEDYGFKREYTARISTSDIVENAKEHFKNPETAADFFRYCTYPLFTKKSDAEYFCKLLNECETNKLNQFNKEHKTNHEVPW